MTFLLALSSALFVAGCDGSPIGLDGGLNGGGSGIGGGGGGGGSATDSGVPSFAFITSGGGHTCALTENGIAWCWGDNSMGGLGIDNQMRTSLPRPVASGSTSFKTISAGGGHTCALDQNNVAWCWGSNTSGALGIGSAQDSSNVPLRVSTSRSWLAISAGSSHTCAIAENGTAFCWGENGFGQLGDGTTTDAYTPAEVIGLSEAIAITAGTDHTCALRSTGAVMCWGNSPMLGTSGSSTTPVFIESTAEFAGLEAGSEITCAIETAVQRAACWGYANRVGSVGATGTAPVRVPIDADIAEVSAGDASACARLTNGLVRCWGNNQFRQLGLGDAAQDTASVTPQPVVGDRVFRQVSVGGAHVCGITPRLETYCWGYNQWQQLGSSVATTGVPTKIPELAR